MKELFLFLQKNRIAPRWVIFLLDTVTCGAALVYANYLRFNFNLEKIYPDAIGGQILLVSAVNAFFFLVFKTYEGIIRFSGLKESLRSATAIFYSFFLISVLNIVCRFIKQPDVVPMSVLIIYFFTATFLVFGYRFLIKNLYNQSIKNHNTSNILIFGGEVNGSMLKRTIEQNGNNNYHVLGFIEDDDKYIGKSIDGIKIFSFAQIKDLLVPWKIKTMFFAKQDFDLTLKNEIVDFCLENDIKVKNLPPINDWIQGQLNLNQIQEVKIEDLLNRPAIKLGNAHVSAYLKSRKVLITGAAGSIGSELARQVAAIYPTSVIVCDQNESGLFELVYSLKQTFGNQLAIEEFIGDVRDRKAMTQLFVHYQPDVVFHAAAYKHVPMMEKHPCEAIKNNVQGTTVLADLSEQFHVERFLLVSTDKAINPTNVMGASKRLAEMYVQALQQKPLPFYVDDRGVIDEKPVPQKNRKRTKFITTRFGNVLGSNGSVIPRFKEQIANGGPVTVTHPDIIRYFMTIPEACSLVLEAATMGNGGELYLFDMGAPVRIVDLATKMIKLAGLVPNKDIEIQFTGLRPGEKLYEELLNKAEEVIPTDNKKILVAKVRDSAYEEVSAGINYLMQLANANRDDEVVIQMKQMVPEFKSKNSKFEVFDIKPQELNIPKLL
ncbi:MAG: polysaccharide biosynthesis protein [Bacteroidetes bacterium]|nr:MAG: polysaccharide biosynthesis protein [Bacteroidota bacterium]TAF93373.1 MAG: polysaccharide biosynthesis protein [Bacteroidota bacterium]